MKNILSVCLIGAIVLIFGYIVYDVLIRTTEPTSVVDNQILQQEILPDQPVTTQETYRNSLFVFQYPSGFTLTENEVEGEITLTNDTESFPINFYTEQTTASNFETYASEVEADMEARASEIPNFSERGFTYSFSTTTQNGLSILTHKRNFEGMIGEVQEAYVWLGNGEVLTISTEDSSEFDAIASSLRLP